MAKKLAQTRFVAAVEERDRQLIGALQKPNGDLIITLRSTDAFGELGVASAVGEKIVAEQRTKEFRISIHRSPSSTESGTTIIGTVASEDGERNRHSLFVTNSRRDCLFEIYTMLCPDLRHARYDFLAKPGDKVVRITKSAPWSATLLVHLWVSTLDRDPPKVPFCALHITDFEYFRLCLYNTYASLRADDAGLQAFRQSSAIHQDAGSADADAPAVGSQVAKCVNNQDVGPTIMERSTFMTAVKAHDIAAKVSDKSLSKRLIKERVIFLNVPYESLVHTNVMPLHKSRK